MKLIIFLFSISSILYATSSYALFDVQAMIGKRSVTAKESGGGSSTSLSGDELKVAAHLSIIPFVPIGLGLALSAVDFKDDSNKFQFDDLKGTEASLEVTAWLPFEIAGVTPYARFGYVLYGAYKRERKVADLGVETKYENTYKPEGFNTAFGINWSPLPLIGILLEVDLRQEKLAADKYEVDGVKLSDGVDVDFNSTGFLIGIEVGL